jgi:multidrug efflux system membrane fusion protein
VKAVSKTRWLIALAVLAAIVALAVHLYGPGSSGEHSERAKATSQSKKSRAVLIVSVPATSETFPIRRRTIGTLESPATVVVRSRIDSQVLEQHVMDGQVVKKGELLFTLDDRELRAIIARDEATLAKDNAALTQAAADKERKEELVTKKVAPQQQLDQAIATYKAAQQTVEADQAVLQADRLKLGYAKLTAPITGRIGAIRVTPGNLVTANDPTGLLTITQVQPIRVAFTLAERDLSALRRAALRKPPATVRVYEPGSDTPLSTGQLDFVDSSVDIASGTIAAKAKFANEKFHLWPGMFVDVEIDLDTRPDTVMIPAVAIQSGQHGPFVFVVKDEKTTELRNVEVVGIEGDRAALKSGVKAGERVVVEGQMRLENGFWIDAAPTEKAATGEKQPASGVSGQGKAQ